MFLWHLIQKFKSNTNGQEQGFTLIELLVVISLMVMIVGAVIANYAGTRSARNLRIGANELVTNVRKVQSYALSSRVLPGNIPAQYYVIRFNPSISASSTSYVIEGLYDTNTSPAKIQDVEQVVLPQGITITGVSVNGTMSTCLLLAFELPFARVLADSQCSGGPPVITDTDDYKKILNFVLNNADTSVTSDSLSVITLSNGNGDQSKVLINGVTGVVCPTVNGLTCLANY